MFAEAIPASPHPAVIALTAAARALVDAHIEFDSLEVQSASMREMRVAIDLIELGYSRTLRSFERRGGPAAAGARSATDWARRECNLSGAAAFDRVSLGRQIDELPLVATAVETGEIGFEHAAVLSRTAADVGPAAAGGVETTLLAEARRSDPTQLRRVAHAYRHEVDRQAFLVDALVKRERRFLRIWDRADGMTALEGLLDPEGGALLRSALQPLMCPSGADDHRAAERRRADALAEVLRRHVYGGGPRGAARRRPQVLVIASDATLRGEPGAPAAEMGRGVMVPAETAQRIACDATVTLVRLGANGRPLGPGKSHRTVTPNEWAALVAQYRGCAWPDRKRCDAPPEEWEADHLDSWTYTRKTDIASTVVLCQKHHRMKHEGGWTLVRDATGNLMSIPPGPDGTPGRVGVGLPGARTWREPPGAHGSRRESVSARAAPT